MELLYVYAEETDEPDLTELFREYCIVMKENGSVFDADEESIPSYVHGHVRSGLMLAAVAKDGGRTVGFIFGNIARLSGFTYEGLPSFGYISDTYICPEYRGMGAGKALTDLAFSWMEEKGVSYVELKALENNSNAMEFWSKMGFTPVSRSYGKRIKEKR